jgi:hypothetical protein
VWAKLCRNGNGDYISSIVVGVPGVMKQNKPCNLPGQVFVFAHPSKSSFFLLCIRVLLAGNKSHRCDLLGFMHHTNKMGKAIILATLMAKIIYKSLNRLYQTLFIGYILPKPLYFVDIKAPIDEIVS